MTKTSRIWKKYNMETAFVVVGIFLFLPTSGKIRADDESRQDFNVANRDHAKLLQQLRTIIIPSIDLYKVTPKEAIRILSDESIKTDPQHKGIGFFGRFTPKDSLSRITLKLQNVSVKEVLSHIVAYDVGNSVVYVWADNGEGVCSKIFHFPNGLSLVGPSTPGITQYKSFDVRKQLEARGAHFPPGSSAIYLGEKQELTVVGRPDVINLVDEILNR